MTTTAERRPFKWGLFRHSPVLVMTTDRNGPVSAECDCGWSTLPTPRPFARAVLEAEERHLHEVAQAIADWRAEQEDT